MISPILALAFLPAVLSLNASIAYGILTAPGSPPRSIGNLSSAISAAIATVFASSGDATLTLKNSTSFYNYLVLTGDYTADAPLTLVPGLALVLDSASLTAASPTLPGTNALVSAVGAPWSAVLGRGTARLACSPTGGALAPYAIYAGQSPAFVVDGLQISDCDCVHLEGTPYVTGGEVANCLITHSRGRAIWTEKIMRAVIHGNVVVNASAHTIDADAFTSNALIMNNTVSLSRQEAVFIEQGATSITVVDNTLGPGNFVGVAVYNNAIGQTTTGHVIARNRIFGCTHAGVSVGSTAPREGAPDMSVLVAGNELWDNSGQGIHTNGGQLGTIYVSNADSDGVSLNTLKAGTAQNISFADPCDRVTVASQ